VGIARYIRQHHIGLIALFIALTGTAYAGTQLTSGPARPLAQQAKKKKKKVKLIPGPQGPAGPQGSAGAPGAARAYAHVLHGTLVAADSTGISAMTRGCPSGGECTAVPAPGTESDHAYCFQLTFVPSSVQVTPDGGQSNSDNSSTADFWAAHVPAKQGSPSNDGCPPGYRSAEVEAFSSTGPEPVTGLYITFN
jgi:hypothetical protein